MTEGWHMGYLSRCTVAFQGEMGAYSEEAALSFFQESVRTLPCRTLSDVFGKVERRESEFGIVPVENSLHGSIGQTYDLMLTSNVLVSGETILKITHCLVTNPNVHLNSVKRVYSHPQALGQCRMYLEKRDMQTIPTYDTAGSARIVKEGGWGDAAAIASERAAAVYGMKVLVKGIETNPQNFTRFFIISQKDCPRSGDDKTSVVFATRHVPGALFAALRAFAQRNINLTKIESRPILGKPWEYTFYLDLEGHRTEEHVHAALEELRNNSTFTKALGSYPRSRTFI